MEQSNIFQVPAHLDKVTPRKDKSVSLTFVTKEISGEEVALLMTKFFNTMGWVLFKENEIKFDDVPEQDADIEGTKFKKPSLRLRNAIWMYAKLVKGVEDNDRVGHEQVYIEQMERAILAVKSKLPEE
ncbi:MAG: hypothetical protein M0R80_17525 [Proteobacteria bacterium]|jgi:hypothetical protein|nr:hypothetical protein [Pseudomonadota bacterium]